MRSHRSLWWQSRTIKALESSLGKTWGEQTYERGFNRAQLHLIFTLKLRWSKPAKVPWVRAWAWLQTVFFFFFQLLCGGATGSCLLWTSRTRERLQQISGQLRRRRADQIQTQADRVLANRIEFPADLCAACTDVKKDFRSISYAGSLASAGRLVTCESNEKIYKPSESTLRCETS